MQKATTIVMCYLLRAPLTCLLQQIEEHFVCDDLSIVWLRDTCQMVDISTVSTFHQ